MLNAQWIFRFSGWVAAAASRGICGVLSVLPARGPAGEFRVSSFEFQDGRIGLANSAGLVHEALAAKSDVKLSQFASRHLALIGIANVFAGSEEEWIRLTPELGDYPHERGIQRIDKAAVTAMANHFNSLKGRLARRFGGVPFYVGHPDVPGLANEYPDKRAYGWVTDLEAREEGLFAKVKWSEPGKELLANSHYKFFSPFWGGDEIGRANGKPIYRPVELWSVALTNKPNLPVNPLANSGEGNNHRGTEGTEGNHESTRINTNGFMERNAIIAALGLANTATDAEITTRLAACVAAYTSLANVQTERDNAKAALSNEQTAKSTLEGQLTTERNSVSALRTELANERKAHATLLVDAAIREGRVPQANRDTWINGLVADFAGKSVALANEKASGPGANRSRTQDQGGRRDTVALENEATRRQELTALMNEKQAKGIPYDVAWAECKRERPELFEAMARPQGAGH